MKTKKRMTVDRTLWASFKAVASEHGFITNFLLEEVLKHFDISKVCDVNIIEPTKIEVEINRDIWFCCFEKEADTRINRNVFLNGIIKAFLNEKDSYLDTSRIKTIR